MRMRFICFLSLSVLSAAACAPRDFGVPVPMEKPAAPPRPVHKTETPPEQQAPYAHGRTGFLEAANAVRLQLALHRQDQVRPALDYMQAHADSANRINPSDSELQAKIVYSREGALSNFIIGLRKGADRYAETLRSLDKMRRLGIEPREIRLVRAKGTWSSGLIRAAVKDIRTTMAAVVGVSPERAFIEADRPLERLYMELKAEDFDADPLPRLQLYLWLSRELIAGRFYALARGTLDEARESCDAYRLKQAALKDAEIAAYREEITSLEKALERRDPGLMSKLGGALREAWFSLKN